MEVKIHIKEKDYLHYVFMHVRRWRSVYYHVLLITFGLLASVIFINIPASGLDDIPGVPEKTMGMIFRVVGIIALSASTLLMLVLLLMYFRSRSEYKSNSFLRGEIKYSFHENGFEVETDVSHAEINKTKIVKVKRSKKILAIYISNNQAYILPKEQLDPATRTDVYQWLKQAIPSAKFNDLHYK